MVIALGIYWHSTATGDTGCALTAAGLGIIVETASKGHSGEAILASTGVGTACKPLIEAVVRNSNKKVSFDLKKPGGDEHFDVPASDITAPAPTSSKSDALTCFLKYAETQFLFDLCRGGAIS